jgi:hypothetical protein
MDKELCIYSYNSRGFDSIKREFIKTVTTTAGKSLAVICNQENFVLKSNAYLIRQALPDHHIFFNPATKEGLDGRPKNGMFVAVPNLIKELVKDVSPHSKRMQSVMFSFDTCKILLINTYFPNDPKTSDFDDTELSLLLSQIKSAIDDNEFDHVIITGDINADFRRKTQFVKLISEFSEEIDLVKSWETFPVDFTHVTEMHGKTYTSTIDHFCVTK